MTAELALVPDSDDVRKSRGAFFTPEPIARFVADWAIRASSDRVLEPSCGEAAFLLQAARRLRELDTTGGASEIAVDGVEIHAPSAVAARRLVQQAGAQANILDSDFFTVEPTPRYNAVIGNPPFIRYQDFSGESRARSRAAAMRAGVPISGLASSWAAFTIHSALFLQPGGRLGLVVPAELLSVNYAAEVRRFLMERFRKVDLVLFTERVFPNVQEDVVLVLADGYGQGSTDHANIFQSQNSASLAEIAAATRWTPESPADKWTLSLLSPEALGTYSHLLHDGSFTTLESWGDTTLGMVTGNNKYFALSPQRARDLGLSKSDMIKLSPPGSSHLRGLALSDSAMRELGQKDASTLLFRPAGDPSDAALEYIAAGEKAGVHLAYKCRVRKPWWRVPMVKPADLFLTYMNADTPRISTNDSKAHHLNSVHGIYLKSDLRELGRALLPLASLTSMTLVGAETVGRAYGGGMLKIEPREADRLPVPSAAVVEAARERLVVVRPQMAGFLRNGKLAEAAKIMDDVLLIGELGMKRSDVRSLREAYIELSSRRITRAKRAKS